VTEKPEKYKIGTRLLFRGTDVKGTVIPNFKLPGDVCVRWDGDRGVSSYDPEFLDEHCEIQYEG
jgi:hypothetical protein